MTGRVEWIVVAHGSRAEGTVDDHEDLCRALADRAGDDAAEVRAAFLELNAPSIPEAIDLAVADGADRVVLLPYFLHAGNHTRRDIPALLAEAEVRHPGVELVLADHLAPHDALVDVLLDRARAVAP